MLRTIGVLTIIAAVVLGIGFAAGWFTFASESHAGETQLTLRVDREEVREDVEDVKLRVKNDGSGASTAPTPTPLVEGTAGTMTGDVLTVDAKNSKLTLRLLTGEERTLVVSADSASGLTRLEPGDRVELATVVEQGRTRIVELRVL